MKKCIKCGLCCGSSVLITKEEMLRIKDYIIKNKIKPISNCFIINSIDCKFLDNNNECMIYEVRPSICENFTCEKEFMELPLIDVEKKYEYFINQI